MQLYLITTNEPLNNYFHGISFNLGYFSVNYATYSHIV